MHKHGHNKIENIREQIQIRTVKTTEKHLQEKLEAMPTQLRPQRKHALQTAENVFHAGFEEWKNNLSAFS